MSLKHFVKTKHKANKQTKHSERILVKSSHDEEIEYVSRGNEAIYDENNVLSSMSQVLLNVSLHFFINYSFIYDFIRYTHSSFISFYTQFTS